MSGWRTSSGVAPDEVPGELMRLTGDALARHGARVRYPTDPGSRCLTVTGLGGLGTFELSADDTGHVQFERAAPGGRPDPRQVADLATVLLTGRAGPFEYLGRGYAVAGITFKGIVGLELRARGIETELEIYPDDIFLDAEAGIRAGSPRHGSDSEFHLADDAGMLWIRDYWAEHCAQRLEPEFSAWLEGKDEIAADIADTLTLAADLLCPER